MVSYATYGTARASGAVSSGVVFVVDGLRERASVHGFSSDTRLNIESRGTSSEARTFGGHFGRRYKIDGALTVKINKFTWAA